MNLRLSFSLAVSLFTGLLLAQVTQIGATPGNLPPNIDRTKVNIVQRLGNQVPMDATFRDATGATRTFGDLVGDKPTVILPIFFLCKGVCGLELQGTIAALKQMPKKVLGRDFNVVVMSIHPKETPGLAQGKYNSTVGEIGKPETDKGWRFVVSDLADIRKVTDAIGFKYIYNEAENTIYHPSGIVFVTPKGVVSSYIYGANYSPKLFTQSLTFAGRDQVGPKAEEIFFGCIHIDPLTGKRSYEIQNILMVMGALTVIVMGGSILVLSGKASFRRKHASGA